MIIKPLGPEVPITTANTVVSTNANTVPGVMLVRVINTGATAVLHLAANTGTEYANISISNSEYVVIEKQKTDTLTGANMLAVPVAQRN